MLRLRDQRGGALILLLGMIAALAILAATLVFMIANQQRATAGVRAKKQSFYAAEAALDTGVRLAKVDKIMSNDAEWLTPAELEAAFAAVFPAGAAVTFRVYDNLAAVNHNIKWDQGSPTAPNVPDQRVWVEATVTYKGQTTRSRVLVQQTRLPFAAALPKAVTYSDTGIKLNGSSDIYAVNDDGSPDTSGAPYITSITAGGTWTPNLASSLAEVGRFTMHSNADLAAPGSSTQSLGITVNGSVSHGGNVRNPGDVSADGEISVPGRTFDHVIIQPGVVGYLSDYFDQAAQVELQRESMEGGTPATAPTAPTAPTGWTSSGFVSMPPADVTSVTSQTLTTTYNAARDYSYSGNLTINRNGSGARTLNFRRLYVTGNLSISGPANVTCTDLYVGGTLTINNTRTTTATDNLGTLYIAGSSGSSIAGRVNVAASSVYCRGTLSVTGPTDATVTDTITGPLYIAGSGSSAVSNRVSLTATSVYCGGSFGISNTEATGVADSLGPVYCVGDFSVSGRVTLDNGTSSLYGGGNVTLTGPSSGTTTHTFGPIYMPANATSARTLAFSGNVNVRATDVTTYGNFTISGATVDVKDWLGHVYVNAISSSSNPSNNRGTINWSGRASVTSRDYTQQADPLSEAAQPKPVWLGRYFSRTGTYNDEYGNVWVPGNSSTSVVFDSTGASSVLCPLLCTTERNEWTGDVTFGTRTQPMVFFFMCDNNGIYPQVFRLGTSSSNLYTGTYYGLMVINESTMDVWGTSRTVGGVIYPTIEGAVFGGCPYDPTHTSGMSMSDIVLNGASSIAYNKAVVGAIATSSLKTTVLVTETVPGSWQQLPVN